MKKFLLVAVIFLLTFNCLTFCVSAEDEAWRKKIENDVWSALESAESVTVIISDTGSVPQEYIDAAVLEATGYSSDTYENEGTFNIRILPKILKKVAADNNIESYTPESLQEKFGAEINAETHKEYDKYIMARRAAIAEYYDSKIDALIQRHGLDESKISYRGSYTGSIIIELTHSEVVAVAQDEGVSSIRIWVNETAVPAPEDVGTDAPAIDTESPTLDTDPPANDTESPSVDIGMQNCVDYIYVGSLYAAYNAIVIAALGVISFVILIVIFARKSKR